MEINNMKQLNKSKIDKDSRKRLVFDVDSATHARIKVESAAKNMSMALYIMTAIKQYFDKTRTF